MPVLTPGQRKKRGRTLIHLIAAGLQQAGHGSRQLTGEVASHGLHWLDEPVSSGVKRAAEGQLAIMVGGEPQVLAHCTALLNGMGRSVLHIGGADAGHAAKTLNNYVSVVGLAATVKAPHVAQRFAIEPTVMTDVLNASTGHSNASENKVKQFMLNGRFDSGFALKLMDKDLHITQALAEDVVYAMTLERNCTALWHDAAIKATTTLPIIPKCIVFWWMNDKSRSRVE